MPSGTSPHPQNEFTNRADTGDAGFVPGGNGPYSPALELRTGDDVPEEKIDTSSLGPMPMTTSVKLSLMALRGYLILMVLLVFYHCADLAGVLGKH